jgi:hypothetical protein
VTKANGNQDGRLIKQAIGFKPETHGEIAALAELNNISFANQVRILVEIGLKNER